MLYTFMGSRGNGKRMAQLAMMTDKDIIREAMLNLRKTPEQIRKDLGMADMVYHEIEEMIESGEAVKYSDPRAAVNVAWHRVFEKCYGVSERKEPIKGTWILPPAGQLKYNRRKNNEKSNNHIKP